ncbi:hypothetical protein LTR56_006238 [Elasticomyces elasticus]|nr:hypothetical protein LTR56_006238 [Elasticomyces elasticus]KAK3666553.1 hypothetical protein LTR22_002497 [Elasticomyces elasticus]KAK4928314.1 hypothetical protein LTR49_004991 [Elasticomyces elasticus]KAK5763877.1 hypothetical protein LTS12_005995 [Elasticomyces elasticus]
MKQKFTNYELVCYDKNLVGETPRIRAQAYAPSRFENRYPGCACDVPAHVYTYSFEPNPDWSSFYANAAEIRKYFEDFAERHDLMPFVKLNTRVISAVWDEKKGIYNVEVESNGQRTNDWCHVFVNGTGFLNDWKWPTIEGLHSFEGELLHSANWDAKTDLTGKKVALIGTGSSAIQMLPRIQKVASHVTSFMRSVTWISPPIGANVLEEEKENAKACGKAASQTPQAQYTYTEEQKKRFREDPQALLRYRRTLEGSVASLFDMFIAGSETSKGAQQLMKAEMENRIGPGHEDLKARLIPSWPPGCRRITPGDGYLEALVQDNVTRVHAEISKVVPTGIIDDQGILHEVDVIACATGFNLAFTPPFNVCGVNGVSMADEFQPEPRVYLSVTVPKFPNYFIINGVRGQWAAGTALPAHEQCVEYILKCAKKIQTEGIKSLEVKEEPITHLYEHMDSWHRRSVWNADCKSWYKNNEVGGKLWIWGGSALHFLKTLQEPRYEHYDVQYRTSNMFAYLGNGQTGVEYQAKTAALAGDVHAQLTPYIRIADTPWHI